jgi:hypothetical protein
MKKLQDKFKEDDVKIKAWRLREGNEPNKSYKIKSNKRHATKTKIKKMTMCHTKLRDIRH